MVYHSLPSKIDTTGIRTLTEKYWINWYYTHKHTFPHHFQTIVSDGQLPYSSSMRFADFSSSTLLKSFLKDSSIKNSKPKLTDGKLICFYPAAYSFHPLLRRDEEINNLYTYAREEVTKWEKSRIVYSLEALAEYPLFRTLDSGMNEIRFSAEFQLGFSGSELEFYRSRYKKQLNDIAIFLQDNVINMYQHYFIVSNCDKIPSCGFLIDKGHFLSGTRSKISAEINGQLFMWGIADYNSNKGERNLFEKNFLEGVLERILIKKDLKNCFEYASIKCKEFAFDEIPENELIFNRIARRDSLHISAAARQYFLREQIVQKKRKNQLYTYMRPKEKLYEIYFGINFGKVQRNLFENKSVTFNPSKGKLSRIFSWILPREKRHCITLLKKLFLGEATDEDIQSLSLLTKI